MVNSLNRSSVALSGYSQHQLNMVNTVLERITRISLPTPVLAASLSRIDEMITEGYIPPEVLEGAQQETELADRYSEELHPVTDKAINYTFNLLSFRVLLKVIYLALTLYIVHDDPNVGAHLAHELLADFMNRKGRSVAGEKD